MKLVVYIDFNHSEADYLLLDFVSDVLLPLAKAHLEHHFFFIANEQQQAFLAHHHLSFIATVPSNIYAKKLWLQFALPLILKKHPTAIFINTNYHSAITTRIPQCLLLPSIDVLSIFSKRKLGALLANVALIISFSQYLKAAISEQFGVPHQKVLVCHPAAKAIFFPASQEQIEAYQQKYAEGKAYFLYVGPINASLLNLLKAFSFFKKRQQSNMQFLLVSRDRAAQSEWIKTLASYKYKNDLQLIWNVQEAALTEIVAGAYALVQATAATGLAPAIQAMQCGVPVIADNNALLQEICGEAALYTDALVFENIADKMMLLFKAEDKRNHFIEKGKLRAAQYSLLNSRELIEQALIKSAPTGA